VLMTESDMRHERTSMATDRSALPWSGFTLVGLTRPVWPARRNDNNDATAARERPARNRPSWARTHSRSTANAIGRDVRDHGLEHGIAQQFRRAVRPDPADPDFCDRRRNCGPSEHCRGFDEQVLRGLQCAVAYLGPDPAGNATLYQVTTLRYGGNANALAVLQSVFSIKSGTRCVSKPC